MKNVSKYGVNISNWQIISSLGNFIIPQGVEFVDPYRIYEKKDIVLKPQKEIKIIATSSPLEINFKANKCFNYLFQTYPQLNKFLEKTRFACDKLSKEELFELRKLGYSLDCILVLEKAECNGPSYKNLEKIKNDLKCLNFINSRWNYRTCYENRKDEKDFLLNWYIFLPVKKLYFFRYEEIRLVDEKGLLVDKYIIY